MSKKARDIELFIVEYLCSIGKDRVVYWCL